ncbi:MAG TPA: response regulator [Verrucomicrobiae bacterium]|jgi:CheY-like chemotaxis protein
MSVAPNLDLKAVFDGLDQGLQQLLGADILLRVVGPADVPALHASCDKLEQVILTLALQARDAMPDGGRLTISVTAVEIGADHVRKKPEARPGHFACLAFQDNGRGLDAAKLSWIFQSSLITDGRETGRGLAVVYGIVKQQNGWIEVESELGRGTTFKVFLPTDAAAEKASTPEPAPVAATPKGETLLVVEDEPILLLLVQGILERNGFVVLAAGNAAEALDLWEQHQNEVDLLLTDISLPDGISGCELAERLQDQNPDLKVIYASGYAADSVSREIEGLSHNVNYLQKPYRPETLAQAVRCCLSSDNGLLDQTAA